LKKKEVGAKNHSAAFVDACHQPNDF
jgi:hypothetical protein